MFDDKGWLAPWACKMMAEKLNHFVDNETLILTAEVLKEAKNAWREKRDTAKDKGVDLHSILEDYIKASINGVPPSTLPKKLPKEFTKHMEEFFDWEIKNKVKWIASEVQVGDDREMFAGIADYVAKVNDKIVVGDFKTSKAWKNTWIPQLVGLRHCLEYQGVAIDGIEVTLFAKGGKFQHIPIEYNHEQETKAFMVAKEFYKQRNLFKGRNK